MLCGQLDYLLIKGNKKNSENNKAGLALSIKKKSKKTCPKSTVIMGSFLEAPSGFEPENKGFADLCLTTWLWRHIS